MMKDKKIAIVKPDDFPTLKRLKVAAYARVSVESELAEHSITNQIESYSRYIQSTPNWDFVGIYADDGFTGTKANRPGFQSMLADCEAGKIDLILAKSISRFARNTVDLLNTLRLLKEKGINVHFEKENIDSTSPSGELMLTLLASFAQEESRSVSENTKWVIHKRFEEGIVHQHYLYGYKWNGTSFEIVSSQAQVIRTIFSDYLNGMSPYGIAKKLNDKGIKSLRGGTFHESHVWTILRLEKYKGDSLLQKTFICDHITKKLVRNTGELPMYYAKGTHPQIIDEKTFDKVQEEIARRAKLKYRASNSRVFSCFTAKVFCKYCGSTFRRRTVSSKNKANENYKYRWKCSSKIDHKASCFSQYVPEKVLYEKSAEVIGIKDFTDDDFKACVECIVVSSPNTLTFKMKDGTEIVKTWERRARWR